MANLKTISASPLPNLDSSLIHNLRLGDGGRNVYKTVLEAELLAVTQRQQDNIMCARVIGYLLVEFYSQPEVFGETACETLINWLTTRHNDLSEYEVVFRNGKHYRDKLLRLFRTSNATYPGPSLPPSRPIFDSLEDMQEDTLQITGNNYQASRRKALARDGYQCPLTGMVDEVSCDRCVALQTKVDSDYLPLGRLEAAHLFGEPRAVGVDFEGDENKTRCAGGALATLTSFGLSEFAHKFRESGVEEVWNLLSLEYYVHQKFNNFGLWFEATEKADHYKVCFLRKPDIVNIRRNSRSAKLCVDSLVVDLHSDREELPPPHPHLLALHATCARVAHLSGAADFFNRIEWDADETNVLAFDGSSAPLLDALLSVHVVADPGLASYVDCIG